MPNPSPLRFLQTGDWHLGQPYRRLGDEALAERLRQGRLDAVGRVLTEARRLGAHLVLAAGDQFDGPSPDLKWLRGMLDQIAAVPGVEVHMIPGNHDPCRPGSVYESSAFRARPANLHFHDHPVAVSLADLGATLYPCPCLARYGPDPLPWIPPRAEADGLRIGLAHGSLPGASDPDGRNFPIPSDAPARHDLDYLALGDWHAPTPDPAARPGGRLYYAGAPEVGGWDEPGAGCALLVDLLPDEPPRVEAIRVGRYRWSEHSPELLDAGDVARLLRVVDERAGPASLLRLRPTGALSADDREALRAGVAERAGSFAALRLDLERLGIARSGEERESSDPLVRAAQRRLERLAADPGDGLPAGMPDELPPVDPEAIGRALARFRSLLP